MGGWAKKMRRLFEEGAMELSMALEGNMSLVGARSSGLEDNLLLILLFTQMSGLAMYDW
jgi:hypothetical protein